MLLLTNCEVHTAKYSDRIFGPHFGPNEMRSVQKTEVRIFFVWIEQLIKGELQRGNKLISYERAFKKLENGMYIAEISQAVLEGLRGSDDQTRNCQSASF